MALACTIALHGGGYDMHDLRRIAAAVDGTVKQVPDGLRDDPHRRAPPPERVEIDTNRLTAYQIDPTHVLQTLRAANQENRAGSAPVGDRETLVETGGFLRDRAEVGSVVVGVHQGQLVYLRDVAEIIHGPEEPEDYVLFGRGASAGAGAGAAVGEEAAVTLAVAKRKGTNAVHVVAEVACPI